LLTLVVCGGEPRRLTSDGVLKLSPTFVGSSAQEIAFCTHEQPALVSIWRLNLADGSRRRLHPEDASHQFDPTFTADGRHHAYALSSTAPQLVLVIQDLQLQTRATFTPRDGRATARYPVFMPDGKRVIFSLSDERGHQIASVDAEGGDLKLLTSGAGMNCWPSVSPDGRRIAFGSSRDGNFAIYTMEINGQNLRRLTKSASSDMRPVWSPDGSRIAFTSTRDGNYEVYVMHADGSHPANVTRHPERDDYPVWFPDVRHLLVVSTRAGDSDLYQFDVPDLPKPETENPK